MIKFAPSSLIHMDELLSESVKSPNLALLHKERPQWKFRNFVVRADKNIQTDSQ